MGATNHPGGVAGDGYNMSSDGTVERAELAPLEKRRAYMASYRAAHRKQMAAYNRAYRARLKQYSAASLRATRRATQFQNDWRMRNKDAFHVIERMRERGRPVGASEAKEIVAEYGPLYPLHRGLNHKGQLWVRRSQERGASRVEAVFEAWERPEFREQPAAEGERA